MRIKPHTQQEYNKYAYGRMEAVLIDITQGNKYATWSI